MSFRVDIQHACNYKIPFKNIMIRKWAETTLKTHTESGEITLRFVDKEEMVALNHTYRKQNKPTNVLAFSSNLPPGVQLACPLLGDVIICPEVLEQESVSAQSLEAHWAHIIIHGILHLLGYDHIEDSDAAIMETHEIQLLAQLGYDNPYQKENYFE